MAFNASVNKHLTNNSITVSDHEKGAATVPHHRVCDTTRMARRSTRNRQRKQREAQDKGDCNGRTSGRYFA